MISKIKKNEGICNTTLDDFKKQDSQDYIISVSCNKHNNTWNLRKSNLDAGKWCKFCGHDKAREKQKLNYLKGKLTGLIPNSKDNPIVKPRILNDKDIIKIAKQHKTLKDFIANNRNVYQLAIKYKLNLSFFKKLD